VRRRFEVGGRREGDAAFVDKERPVGAVRVGGRNEGLPPFTDIFVARESSIYKRMLWLQSCGIEVRYDPYPGLRMVYVTLFGGW